MITMLFATATASTSHFEVSATLGMRAGVSGQATVEPLPHLELGGRLHLATDVYAGAPGWVRRGLDARHDLHTTGLAVVGVNSGPNRVSIGLFAGAGLELSTFREVKTVLHLEQPVIYGATGVRPAGALILELRVRPRPERRIGGSLQLVVPMPLAPTGFLYIDRIHIGLGVHL